MLPGRIRELLAPFLGDAPQLFPAQLQHISNYIDILLRWNARLNLTAVRGEEHIVTRHFGESLFAARHLYPSPPTAPGQRLLDVGSGAGFPGLPIKIWAPAVSVTLIEANHKKATFLREVGRALTLTGIDILAARAETLPPAQADVVTLRAVERFQSALPLAARLVRPAGRLALLAGSSQLDAARRLASSFTWSEPIPIPLSSQRVLALATRPQEPSQ